MRNIAQLFPRWFAVMIAISVAVIAYGTLQVEPADEAPAPLQHELFDVLWLDKYPEMSHEKWKAYFFSSDNVGISIDAQSAFKLTLELFEFKAESKKIRFHFPHDGRKAQCGYTIEKLKKPTRHFDTKLIVENDPQNAGQTKEYFTGPEFRSAATLPENLRQTLEAHEVLSRLSF
ncbi:MAG: hypothetical protein HY319_22485 [Armatimonadetes bacterium]|nr:hypothetical protein [Armatimonadota bacterium]